MPSKILLALNKARMDLQKQSLQKVADSNSVQAVVGSSKSPTRNRSNQPAQGVAKDAAWSQKASRLLARDESLNFLRCYRESKYNQ